MELPSNNPIVPRSLPDISDTPRRPAEEVNPEPQMYVRLQVLLSYPHPFPPEHVEQARKTREELTVGEETALLQSELDRCSRAIRRAIQKALHDDMLNARLGGNVTVMSVALRQEDRLDAVQESPVNTLSIPPWNSMTSEQQKLVLAAARPLLDYGKQLPTFEPEHKFHEPHVSVPRGPAQPGDLGYRRPHALDRLDGAKGGVSDADDWGGEDNERALMGLGLDEDVPPNAGSAQ